MTDWNGLMQTQGLDVPASTRQRGCAANEAAETAGVAETKQAMEMENETMLRKLMKYMENHNIQDYGVELPQIAVMGDTSSGKSSLLSAISGVIFPSADGM